MNPKLVIIGAGGHAKVVCDAVESSGDYRIAGFVDANVPVGTVVTPGYKVILHQDNLDKLKSYADYFIVAIGNNKVREELFNRLSNILKPATVIHSSAAVAGTAELKPGSVILANAVVSAFSTIGENTIVNAGVVVDHESVIGNNVHLSIGTMVGSNSTVADHTVTAIGQHINAFSKL
ncbi:MAG: protein with transferase hexapeptide repeat domain [Bacteroidetes bacterium]|nr:protein with transferase hexapeptide repeat domain [Bacteroidota bacterium]